MSAISSFLFVGRDGRSAFLFVCLDLAASSFRIRGMSRPILWNERGLLVFLAIPAPNEHWYTFERSSYKHLQMLMPSCNPGVCDLCFWEPVDFLETLCRSLLGDRSFDGAHGAELAGG